MEYNKTVNNLGCPIKGTLVTLPDGSVVNIETLKKGDLIKSVKIDTYIDSNDKEVLTWSNSNLEVNEVETRIKSIEEIQVKRVIHINDNQLRVSESHTHLVRKSGYWKFVNIMQVNVGDFMYTELGDIVKIEDIKFISGDFLVYKMILDSPYHLFYANNILTHNYISEN